MPSHVFIGADGKKDNLLYQRLKVLAEISDEENKAILLKGGKIVAEARDVTELQNVL